jgi:transcription elongation GreA/GreB family factor
MSLLHQSLSTSPAHSEQLENGQVTNGETTTTNQETTGDEHRHRVAGGYRATLKRDDVSEEAKQHARDELTKVRFSLITGSYIRGCDGAQMGEPFETPQPQKVTEEDAHEHRVQGGMKAALANENTSEEKKDELRAKLDAAGVSDHS